MPSPIATSTNSTVGAPITQGKGNSTLDMQTFLKLLTVQLTSQDPLNPVTDSQFAAQLAEMGTVQGMDNLQQAGQVQMAASLIGKTVTAGNPNLSSTDASPVVTGQVIGVTNHSGTFNLTIQAADGSTIDVSTTSIQTVTN